MNVNGGKSLNNSNYPHPCNYPHKVHSNVTNVRPSSNVTSQMEGGQMYFNYPNYEDRMQTDQQNFNDFYFTEPALSDFRCFDTDQLFGPLSKSSVGVASTKNARGIHQTLNPREKIPSSRENMPWDNFGRMNPSTSRNLFNTYESMETATPNRINMTHANQYDGLDNQENIQPSKLMTRFEDNFPHSNVQSVPPQTYLKQTQLRFPNTNQVNQPNRTSHLGYCALPSNQNNANNQRGWVLTTNKSSTTNNCPAPSNRKRTNEVLEPPRESKTGETPLRILTGTVDSFVNWKKKLIKTEFMFLYEVIAKCLAIRDVVSTNSKLLLLRDDGGAVIQAVFYQLEFPLSEDIVKGKHVRVIGRALAGNKLHAFSVRLAGETEIANLKRLEVISNNAANKVLNKK